jgi:hypothetical protein
MAINALYNNRLIHINEFIWIAKKRKEVFKPRAYR